MIFDRDIERGLTKYIDYSDCKTDEDRDKKYRKAYSEAQFEQLSRDSEKYRQEREFFRKGW